jgi:CHAT domain-containing protein
MVVGTFIDENRGNVGIRSTYFIGKLTSLSFLLFACHSKFRSFVKDSFIGFYSGEKLEKLGPKIVGVESN